VWVAFILGILLQFFVWTGAPDIMAFLSPNTQVAGLAVAYLRARSWGIPAALIMMVGIGAARGHKEMEGPFVGSAAYGVVLGLLDLLFVFGLKAGVDGAGAAAAVAQWVGAAAIMYVLARRGEFNGADLRSLPGIAAVVPYAAMAPSLALNSMAALAPMVMATSITTGLGPDQLAAHTVLRQLSAFWLQAFLAFNATAHSLVASALGSAQRSMGMDKAAAGLERICQLAVAMSVPLALILFGARAGLPAIFTADAAVVADVSAVLPLLLLTMVSRSTAMLQSANKQLFCFCFGMCTYDHSFVLIDHVSALPLLFCSPWMPWARLWKVASWEPPTRGGSPCAHLHPACSPWGRYRRRQAGKAAWRWCGSV